MGQSARRFAMVQRQLRDRGIADERVLAAMEAVPRHEFVPRPERRLAYDDRPLPIGGGQTISQPWMVARMAEALELDRDAVVLEVGGGSGYAAAVLAELAARVVTIEQDATLAARASSVLEAWPNVTVVVGDGGRGLPDQAPFDGISIAAAAATIPPPLRDQLADGGHLVMPVGPPRHQRLVHLRRDGDEFVEDVLAAVRFVPLTGEHGAD
ncbi:MAG TPA: protein-L-isoaspartate(D-aspartate) O-methyltransferase [Nitriliruptoraceae bacterium]|nr:protein-L-isoaspartate(D-aspartate) O-methyltransferase [Nitriliruptoraceae bacterium]